MINLLPLTKVIAAIAALYAGFISIILFFFYDIDAGITKNAIVATKGATVLNLLLLGFIYFGWKWLWKKVPLLNNILF